MVALIGAVLVVGGCGGPREFKDPIAAMTDPRLASRENFAAMDQARARFPDDPKRIEQLKEIISGPSYSIEFRAAAWRQLEER